MPQEAKTPPEILAKLRQNLTDYFSDEELHTLCFDMGVDYESLPSLGKAGKAREFVAHLERCGRLAELVARCRKLRRNVSWPRVSSQGSRPARLFICYKRHADLDQRLAAYLREFLTAQGHEVFIDATMRAGAAWLDEIDQQIKDSDFLITLLSKDSADSEMVQAEVSRAYEYRQLQGRPLTLPIRITYEGPLPYTLHAFLNPLQYIVWNGEPDDERVGREILVAIEGRLPMQPLNQARLVTPSDDKPLPPPSPVCDPTFLEELEPPGGPVEPGDRFYVEREADARLKREVVKRKVTVTIRAARQTGKSSLLVRGVQHAREVGDRIVYLDVQAVGSDRLASPDTFLRDLAELIVGKLRLDVAEVDKLWRGSLGPQTKLISLMEDYVLPQSKTPIVLALDEVDRLLQTTFHNDFFGLLRSWHNNRADNPLWNKLKLLMVISTEPQLLITDIQSPFNVGLNLYLKDFSEAQVRDLNWRHGSPVQETDLARLMNLLNGHPYLTRKALYTLVTEGMTIDDLLRVAATDQGPFGDHLRRLQWLLRGEHQRDLREALKQIIQRERCVDDELFFRLLRAGVVKGSGDVCKCRCDLYRLYLKDKL
jgi:hypothetical protein